MILNKAANTTILYYDVTNTRNDMHAVDWSPNDRMIAFGVFPDKLIVLNATSKSVKF